LKQYKNAIIPINRRLNEIFQAKSNANIVKNNLDKAFNLLNNYKPKHSSNEDSGISLENDDVKLDDSSSNKDKDKDDEESMKICDYNHAKFHFINLCKILKGYKLVALNKFYNNFYSEKKFVNNNNLNENKEIDFLATKFEIDVKLVKRFIDCKKFL
jgi:hypothetical protein